MSDQSMIYAAPTHLREREPFAFGRTAGELAKLVVIGFIAARLTVSTDFPIALRLTVAGLLLVVGAAWALLRIQNQPLDAWLGLAFRYGARPRRRVWRPSQASPASVTESADTEAGQGWHELQHVRVRWAEGLAVLGSQPPGLLSVANGPSDRSGVEPSKARAVDGAGERGGAA